MVFYATVASFLVTTLMNTFISTIMGDWNLDETHANYQNEKKLA